MTLILHNIKVALRNIDKYKLQSLISVLSIAVGILTLSFAHSFLSNIKLNALYDLPFIDRTYNVSFKSITSGDEARISGDIVRTLKKGNVLKSAEHVVVPLSGMSAAHTEFTLPDSTKRIGHVSAECIDPDFLEFAGFRSAITGKPITELKKGQAIIGEELAKEIFQGHSPIGSIQEQTSPVQPIPVSIVDVYKSMHMVSSNYGEERDIRDELLFSLADRIIDQDHDLFFLLPWINVVLKEGYSEQQLMDDINQCVLPFGVEAVLDRTLDNEEVRFHYAYKAFIYLFGSLILVASIIGFLRTQIQLFRMRRGEIALRMVNGAYWRELFSMLVTEPFLIICLSVLTAILLGFPLQEFFQSNRPLLLIKYQEFKISGLWLFSVEIGVGLVLLVAIIAWFSLQRVCKTVNGLSGSMRHSRNHLFRNVMMGFQIAVSLIFVCCTLLLVNIGRNMVRNCNIPEKDALYAQCLILNTRFIYDEERIQRVCAEIGRMPEVDKIEMYTLGSCNIKEIKNNTEAMKKMEGRSIYQCVETTDKDLPSFLGMEVEWFTGNVDRNECILVGENLYRKLRDTDILYGNTLSFDCGGPRYMISLPIGGIIKNVPYTKDDDQFVAISQYWGENFMNMTHIVIPKEGKGKDLDRKVDRVLRSVDPENIANDYMILNYRDSINWIPSTVSAVYVVCLVLGSVSLLICAMGIFSAIALDTRGRRKEVAIRKVNGAKGRDIYRMFGRLYIILIAIALLIAIPVCGYFARILSELEIGSIAGSVSPYMPIILGSIFVILLILLIVHWQIRKVLHTDTSKIIAKE